MVFYCFVFSEHLKLFGHTFTLTSNIAYYWNEKWCRNISDINHLLPISLSLAIFRCENYCISLVFPHSPDSEKSTVLVWMLVHLFHHFLGWNSICQGNNIRRWDLGKWNYFLQKRGSTELPQPFHLKWLQQGHWQTISSPDAKFAGDLVWTLSSPQNFEK